MGDFVSFCIFYLIGVVNLTNRFHIAVCLFSNRSQMASKSGKNKKVAHEARADHVTGGGGGGGG